MPFNSLLIWSHYETRKQKMEVWSEDAAKKVENRKSRVKRNRLSKGWLKQGHTEKMENRKGRCGQKMQQKSRKQKINNKKEMSQKIESASTDLRAVKGLFMLVGGWVCG